MRTLLILLGLVLSGCAGAAGGGGGGRNPDLITSEQLRELDSEGLSALQTIERLRPRWLRGRGTSSFGGGASMPKLVVDGVPFGELGQLRSMRADGIAEMRYLSARDATTQFGTGYDGGAILVVRR